MTELYSVSPPIAESPAPQNGSGGAVLERSVVAPNDRRQTGGSRINLASSPIKEISKTKANRKAAAVERVDSRERSGIQLYLNEIGKFPLLSREEEVELAEQIKAGDRKARERMISSNLRLVVKIAYDLSGLRPARNGFDQRR